MCYDVDHGGCSGGWVWGREGERGEGGEGECGLYLSDKGLKVVFYGVSEENFLWSTCFGS